MKIIIKLMFILALVGIIYGIELLPSILRCDNFNFKNVKSMGTLTIHSHPINGIINGYICYIDDIDDKTTVFKIHSAKKTNITKSELKHTLDYGLLSISHLYFNGTFSFDSAQITHTKNIIISLKNPILLNNDIEL